MEFQVYHRNGRTQKSGRRKTDPMEALARAKTCLKLFHLDDDQTALSNFHERKNQYQLEMFEQMMENVADGFNAPFYIT
jgi:hypothetical protein